MTLSQERIAEAEDDAYSQGFSDGFQQGKAAAILAVNTHFEENPWPYAFKTATFHIVDVEGLLDKIHNAKP